MLAYAIQSAASCTSNFNLHLKTYDKSRERYVCRSSIVYIYICSLTQFKLEQSARAISTSS